MTARHRTRRLAGHPDLWLSALGVAAALIGVGLLVFLLPGGASPVARVAGTPITRSTFAHWLNSAALTASAQNPGFPAAVPDPPRYQRCAASLRRAQSRIPRGQSPPTDAQLRGLCARDYSTLRDAALQLLIDAQWLMDEGRREHLSIPESTIDIALRQYVSRAYPARGSLDAYLHRVGQTPADLRFQIRVSLTATRLEALHVPSAAPVSAAAVQAYYATHPAQYAHQTLTQAGPAITGLLVQQRQAAALAAYTGGFQRYWQARTTCASGFRVAALCRSG